MVKSDDELFAIGIRVHVNILKIDAEKALQMEGVVDFISNKDLSPERNKVGLPVLIQGEEVFISRTVYCVVQIIGAVIVVDITAAERAAKEVIVLYEDLPAILTITQAIEAKSFYVLKNGNPDKVLTKCDYIIEGEMITGTHRNICILKFRLEKLFR